jgi:hypothetical protein
MVIYQEDGSDYEKTFTERTAIIKHLSGAVSQHLLSMDFEASDFTTPVITQLYHNIWRGDTHFDEETSLIQRTFFELNLTHTKTFYLNVMIVRSYIDRTQGLYCNKFRVFVRDVRNYNSHEITCKKDIFNIKALRKSYQA